METIILYNTVGLISFLLATRAERKDSKIVVLSIILLFSFLAGLRSYNVGLDTKNYVFVFESIYDEHATFETVFIGLVRALTRWGLNYTFILCFFSITTNILIVSRYWQLREVVSFNWSILCYYILFYFNTMSGIRQCLAVAIVFFFSKYAIEEWNLKRFLLGIVLGMLIHRTALIGVFLIVPRLMKEINIHRLKPSQFLLFLMAPVVAFLGVFLAQSRYSMFISQTTSMNIGFMAFARLIVVLMVSYQYIITKKDWISQLNQTFILRACLFSEYIVLFAVVTSYVLPNVWRIGWYFWLYSPALYSYYLSKKAVGTSINIAIRVGIIAILLITWIGILNGYDSRLVPFEFFWQVR